MKISVITPSFNQGKYIERTILSVINQRGSFELEYIIIDGGSTDNTLDLIKKYQDSLTWISETDRGQSDAINKGFNMATGDLFAWLNADDTYEENALSEVVERYREYRFKWCFGNCRNINEDDQEIRRLITRYKIAESKRYSYRRLLSKDFISQPAVFFTKDIYREIGPLDINCQYSMDYDYWLRIAKKYNPHYINKFLANFRWHGESKNSTNYKKAAYETYLTAKRHATTQDKYLILRHYLHYRMLSLVYRFL
ncbi:MAG: glycosyltransferase [Deltaproteobacteria bacterium]|nr:glycosyltransferase [Deltaproteobacteria bacterium]RLB81606.1 MAG: glycosyltransferase [Deltaproteobacteria bacterium]